MEVYMKFFILVVGFLIFGFGLAYGENWNGHSLTPAHSNPAYNTGHQVDYGGMYPTYSNVVHDPITGLPSCIGSGCHQILSKWGDQRVTTELSTSNVPNDNTQTGNCGPFLQVNTPRVVGYKVYLFVNDVANEGGSIMWGDGKSDQLLQSMQNEFEHDYSKSGKFTIIVKVYDVCNDRTSRGAGYQYSITIPQYDKPLVPQQEAGSTIERKATIPPSQTTTQGDKLEQEKVLLLGIIGIIIAFFSSILGWRVLGIRMQRPKIVKPLEPDDIHIVLRDNSKAARRVTDLILNDSEMRTFSANFVKEFEERRKALPDNDKEGMK